jgi:hypothetical protein
MTRRVWATNPVSVLRRPWLIRSHPNFALIFVSTAIFHLVSAVILFSRPESIVTPSLQRTVDALSAPAWGTINAVVFVLMVAGLYQRTFTMARVGLALGTAMAFARCVLLFLALTIDGAPTGLGVPVWGLVAMLHFSQVAEPPVNPATSTNGHHVLGRGR